MQLATIPRLALIEASPDRSVTDSPPKPHRRAIGAQCGGA